MSQEIRPKYSFVLHLWREPDAGKGDAGWRGVLHPLTQKDQAIGFQDLNELVHTIRPFLHSQQPEK